MNKFTNKRKKSRKFKKKTLKKRRYLKKGGASDNQTFNNIRELTNYLSKNNHWIERVDVYYKKTFEDNEKPEYKYNKKQFSNLYEIGNVNQYIFQFY